MAKDEKKEEKTENSGATETKTETSTETPNFLTRNEFDAFKSEMAKANEFIAGAVPILKTIADNPDLTAAFRKAHSGVQGEQQTQDKGAQDKDGAGNQSSQTDKKVNDVVATQRANEILAFEREYGIDQLKEEEAKEVRGKIAYHMSRYGAKMEDLPVSAVREALSGAYLATHAEKLREEGKLEGITTARRNAHGAMPQFAGGAPASQDQVAGLTDKQESWAKKLGVDPEKAKETYLNRENEEKRVKANEQKSA